MRNMLLKLSDPTKDGAMALEAMGVSVFDTEGKMRSLADIFNDLDAKKVDYTVTPYMDINNLTALKNLIRQTNDINEVIKLLKHL